MYDIFVLYFSEETIHQKVSICGHQGTDDETGLIALPLMVHIKTADLVVGEELIDRLIDLAFAEDIGDGDHTTLSCIPATAKARSISLSINVDNQAAEKKMASFFSGNRVSGFTVNHQGKRNESSFIVGTLKPRTETSG